MDWQVIVTLVIAIITGFVAYLNYRTRPLLMRTKEKHSEDLKQVLEQWLSELSETGGPIRPLHNPKDPCSFYLSVETNPLFLDLKEHMLEGADPLTEWQKLKNACDPYDTGRRRLYDRICNDAQRVGKKLFVAEFYAEHVADLVYNEAISIARAEPQRSSDEYLKVERQNRQTPNGPKPWFELSTFGRMLVSGDNEEQVTEVMSYLTLTLENLSRPGTEEGGYADEARTLEKTEQELSEQYDRLLRSIREMLATPILVGECKYIRRATEPFAPLLTKVKRVASRVWRPPKTRRR